MARNWKGFSAVILAGFLFLAGCSTGASPQGGDEASKELTPAEVLEKTNEVFKNKNFTYEATNKQKMIMDIAGQQQNIDVDINFTIDMTSNPMAYHVKGTGMAMGKQIPMEMYIVDNTMYTHDQMANRWTKMPMNLSALDASQDPSAALKQLALFLNKLGGGKLPEGISLKKEAGAYRLDIDYTKLTDKKELDMFRDQFLAGFQAGANIPNLNINKSQIKVDQLNQQIWIDEKTFEQTKMIQDFKMSMPVEGSSFKVESHAEMNLKGEFKGKIEVPADIKNQAKSL